MRGEDEETVKPLELFFDLVFVLALTQCTALMAEIPTWEGLAKGLLVLGVLWWAWVGYAWLTSVIDPDEGAVRLVMFAVMAAFLVCALCVPRVFDDAALTFAIAYAFVRFGQIALFEIASRDQPELRKSVNGLAASTAVGVGLLAVASALDGAAQGAMWAIAIGLDAGGPYFFGQDGWKLVPGHFAERHGLIVIIAIGESIVAIGAGVEGAITTSVVAAAVLGTVVAAAMWWLYFDVVAIVAERRLTNAEVGSEQNGIARDSYSYLHFPMVAGIVLFALGMKKVLVHTGDPLKLVPAVAMLGGVSMYLLAHVAFRMRNVHSLNRPRLVSSVLVLGLIPLATEIPALATLAILGAGAVALVLFETVRYAEKREHIRHELEHSTSFSSGRTG
jgi:low temperature requirement protein LtrA